MLKTEQIKKMFFDLNEKLKKTGNIGEVGIVGGAVMCVVYQTRVATKDVDAVFEPTKLIRKLAAEVGEDNGVKNDWLNDAVKGYLIGSFEKQEVLELSNLRVWAPNAKYMLAMKCISARWDTHDREDVIFLIGFLKIKTSQSVFELIENYYPKKTILPKTQFFIEELFEKKKKR